MGRRALSIQKIHQLAVMLRRNVGEAATGLATCGMGQREGTVDFILDVELTLDLHPVPDQEREIGANLKTLRGEIHQGAEARGSVAAQKSPPVDRNAKVMTWIGHGVPFSDTTILRRPVER